MLRLENFIRTNRSAIIFLARARSASRLSPRTSDVALANGIPAFLDQLGEALRVAQSTDAIDHEQIGVSARLHGRNLYDAGFNVAQVVRDYGDICQAIGTLATDQVVLIAPEEFTTLNLCLDDAIAESVTEFARRREHAIEALATDRLAHLAHEMRNHLHAATLTYDTIKGGTVAIGGSTGIVLGRSIASLNNLVDRSLADVRLDMGLMKLTVFSVADFIEEVEAAAVMFAARRGLHFDVGFVKDRLMNIHGDRQTLVAAMGNLLQNAFKFTKDHGHVTLNTTYSHGRVLMAVQDECGGLPDSGGSTSGLFRPYEQFSEDKSGLGLGLMISRKAAKASHGEILVRDLPGRGCVFTLDMPRA